MEPLVLSQVRLLAFLTCRRRFRLRCLDQLTWPDIPLDPKQYAAVEQGQKFHLLLERYFLGLPINELEIADRQLQTWWKRFANYVLPLPSGRTLPELRLTVPIGRHFLSGRFDLAIINTEVDQPLIHIYDWKTSRPRPEVELQDDWQTKLYLAMMAESKSALVGKDRTPCPSRIKLTYWYVSDPQTDRPIAYSQEQHEQNWLELQTILAEIESCLQMGDWPLTDNWSHCRTCAYGVYCGRFSAGSPQKIIAEELGRYEVEPLPFLEPESP